MTNIDIGKRISEYRRRNNMTQMELAELMMVSNKTISKWETGINLPDMISIKKLCEIFDISIDQFLSNSKRKYDGENFKKTKISRNIVMKIMIFLIFIIFLIIIVVISLFPSYNDTKIYSLESGDKVLYLSGKFIVDNNKYSLYLNNIEFLDYDLSNDYACNFEYLISLGDNILYRVGYLPDVELISDCTSINNILKNINVDITEELYFDFSEIENEDMMLTIKYENENGEIVSVKERIIVHT